MKLLLIILSLFFYLKAFQQEKVFPQKIETSLLKNLHQLNDSIFRSDQPDSLDIELLKELGIKSLLNLRRYYNDTIFIGKNSGLNLYHVKMYAHCFTNKKIIDALKIIKNAPKPLLIHCKHGSDRTGVVIAMYRIVFDNFSKKEALKELRNKNYGFHRIFINIPLYIKTVKTDKIRSKLLNQ